MLLHFIFGTPVFFQLSMAPLAFHANYNRDIIQVLAVILTLFKVQRRFKQTDHGLFLKGFNGKITAKT